ncbi:MAG: hypothetical protein ACP5UU_05905 [Thermoprotei archaeon]
MNSHHDCLLGDSLFGFLSDRAGRKKIFAATMMSYGLGLLLISASTYADSFLGLIPYFRYQAP